MLAAVVGLGPLIAVAVACAPAPTTGGEEPTGVIEGSQAIVNGELDEGANPWTCALMEDFGEGLLVPFCTATILRTEGATGFAISAAHCQSSRDLYLACTDSFEACRTGGPCDLHEVTDSLAHPSYDGGPARDLMMMTFSGATAATQAATLPAAGEVPAVGTPCEVVGYGLTNGFDETPSDDRRRAFSELTEVFVDAYVAPQSHEGPFGGTCSGDSGGPLFVGAGEEKRLVGITSSGDEFCDQDGYYGSIDFNLAWIHGYMEGGCSACVSAAIDGGPCSEALAACRAEPGCDGLFDCIAACDDQACKDACATTFESGLAAYDAIIACAHCEACAEECRDPACGGAGGAGGGAGTSSGGGGAPGGATGGVPGDWDEDDRSSSCGCEVPGAGTSGKPALLAALGVGLVGRRRRGPFRGSRGAGG